MEMERQPKPCPAVTVRLPRTAPDQITSTLSCVVEPVFA
jgi:hypothetical protein